MGSHSIRKRCRDCKQMRNGTPGKTEWCDCGGELATVKYGPRKRKSARGG